MESRYETKPMTDWAGVDADLAVTDPPFGLGFDGKASNYNRDESRVVDGYVEWDPERYAKRCSDLLDVLDENTVDDGQALVFSGWNNSHVLHRAAEQSSAWTLEGKMYWNYNFAPYCTRRPAHNVYEIYWLVKSDDWYYTNECSFEHCQEGEANLSAIDVNRDYLQEREKYPTRLPPKIVKVLVEHYSEPGDRLFDPLAGSGTVGVVGEELGREYVLGDSNTEGGRVFENAMVELGHREAEGVAD